MTPYIYPKVCEGRGGMRGKTMTLLMGGGIEGGGDRGRRI
jgi:hypothetical protein